MMGEEMEFTNEEKGSFVFLLRQTLFPIIWEQEPKSEFLQQAFPVD